MFVCCMKGYWSANGGGGDSRSGAVVEVNVRVEVKYITAGGEAMLHPCNERREQI